MLLPRLRDKHDNAIFSHLQNGVCANHPCARRTEYGILGLRARAHPVRGKDRSPPHRDSFLRTNFLPASMRTIRRPRKGVRTCL